MEKKKSRTTQQLITHTERKASGCNWEMYKNLISKPKTEKNNDDENVPWAMVNKNPKPKRIHTTYFHTASFNHCNVIIQNIALWLYSDIHCQYWNIH